jgi:hypothetical protein
MAKMLPVTYADIERITKKHYATIRKDATDDNREGFDFDDLESVIKYCAKWAPLAFKVQLFEAMCAPSGGDTRRTKK